MQHHHRLARRPGTGIIVVQSQTQIAFGNIGTKTRLDFTVIGPAVNQASRIQDLTKEMGIPILASGEFAALAGEALRLLGARTVRGVSAPIDLFAPKDIPH